MSVASALLCCCEPTDCTCDLDTVTATWNGSMSFISYPTEDCPEAATYDYVVGPLTRTLEKRPLVFGCPYSFEETLIFSTGSGSFKIKLSFVVQRSVIDGKWYANLQMPVYKTVGDTVCYGGFAGPSPEVSCVSNEIGDNCPPYSEWPIDADGVNVHPVVVDHHCGFDGECPPFSSWTEGTITVSA